MNNLMILSYLVVLTATVTFAHPYIYNPYYNIFRQNDPYYYYHNHIQQYTPIPPSTTPYLEDRVLSSYLSQPNHLPTLNILAEIPYEIKQDFTVVPMLVVAKENMHMVSSGHILGVSNRKPVMSVKTEDSLLQCTPAVKIHLKNPIVVYSLKTSILFPAEVTIMHEHYRIPIKVGAVIAPVSENTFVSTESPVTLSVVYAVPTKPIRLDYVNNQNVFVHTDSQSVVVDTHRPFLPPQNITIINFPDKQAEPVLEVDEEDAELVHRQPPIVLAPAGIAQSTQPETIYGPFSNSKESAVLTALREEALKQRL